MHVLVFFFFFGLTFTHKADPRNIPEVPSEEDKIVNHFETLAKVNIYFCSDWFLLEHLTLVNNVLAILTGYSLPSACPRVLLHSPFSLQSNIGLIT